MLQRNQTHFCDADICFAINNLCRSVDLMTFFSGECAADDLDELGDELDGLSDEEEDTDSESDVLSSSELEVSPRAADILWVTTFRPTSLVILLLFFVLPTARTKNIRKTLHLR
jgi:hypothetical protein